MVGMEWKASERWKMMGAGAVRLAWKTSLPEGVSPRFSNTMYGSRFTIELADARTIALTR
jgi:hypothetical protein